MVNLIAGETDRARAHPGRVHAGGGRARGGLDADRPRPRRADPRRAWRRVRARLGGPGASRRAAEAILRVVRNAEPLSAQAETVLRTLRTSRSLCQTERMRTLVVCCLLLALALPARATVLIPADLGELSRDALAIARGRVAALDAQWTDGSRDDRDDRDARGRELPEGRARIDAAVPRARRRARPLPQHRRRRAGVRRRPARRRVSRRARAERAATCSG